jgi:hypothetical protein
MRPRLEQRPRRDASFTRVVIDVQFRGDCLGMDERDEEGVLVLWVRARQCGQRWYTTVWRRLAPRRRRSLP